MHTQILDYPFVGAQDPPDVGSRDSGPFCQATVASGGSPHVKAVGGFMELYLDTTLENQLACFYQGDVLGLDIDRIKQVDFWCKLASASVHASISLSFGVVSARANDPDDITALALFRLYGSGAVNCETDDGTNNNDDVATGVTLGSTLKRFSINFASGVKTVSPPSPSVGGKSNVLFSCDAGDNVLRPVCRNTLFDMGNYGANLQLFAQIQKGASSSVIDTSASAKLKIERIRVKYQTGE